MVEEFLKEYAKLIADCPELIKVERVSLGENFDEIIAHASKADTGRLIGKDGKMINAIKTVIIGCKAKDPTSYRITVKAIEE
ncbi:KH domain RNA binding protein YlqC [Campylobacter hyointestinalis subsp. hyointestinalis]|uniref:KH domain RNA binding protein YlqC n=1 Tax=Campylobacter hyointestinalis subsp. hyointestinalis TaxID=91352 RepID=A0A9W5ALT5_CAMHY|nr:KH domain-containing protein [Campylobacter hyointestinalis]CUU69491.1 KH domain RNA binding protein YlqC [Campylobacter hyointestinalis subsp. hyointestinalis]